MANDLEKKNSETDPTGPKTRSSRSLVVARDDLSIVSVSRPSVTTRRAAKASIVLDEETYIKNLEKIIERDFFPDLERLKLKSRYLDAMKHNDYESAKQIYSQLLTSRSEQAQTPLTKEAEMEALLLEKKSEGNKRKLAAQDDELPFANREPPEGFDEDDRQSTVSSVGPVKKRLPNLDGFLSQTTSEDNVSFDSLIQETETKNALKTHHVWLHDKEVLHQIKQEELLKLENGDGVKSSMTSSQLAIQPVDTWTYTSKNSLMYVPEGVQLTDEEERERNRKIRVINHSNTRFSETLSLVQTSSVSTPSTDLDGFKKPSLPLITVAPKIGIDGKEMKRSTPNIRGYGFVDASPSPMPGAMNGDESPMMTWGEIDSTPFRLDPSASPLISSSSSSLPEFKIAELSDRERLALDLEEKANAARRKKKQEALMQVQKSLAVTPSPKSRSTPSPFLSSSRTPTQSVSEKITGMSPAAQRLLSKNIKANNTPSSSRSGLSSSIFLSSSSKSSSSRDMGLTSPSVTPSSMDKLRSNLVRPSSTKSTGPATPSHHPSSSSITKSTSTAKSADSSTLPTTSTIDTSSLTDNLLKLPNH